MWDLWKILCKELTWWASATWQTFVEYLLSTKGYAWHCGGIWRWIPAIPGLLRAHRLSVETDTYLNNSDSKADCDKCYHRGRNNMLWSLGEGNTNLTWEYLGLLQEKEEFDLGLEETCWNAFSLGLWLGRGWSQGPWILIPDTEEGEGLGCSQQGVWSRVKVLER